MNPCILISTYDRYRPIAEFTARMIDRYWPGHPAVYFCGCSERTDGRFLPLRDPPADWIGIHRSAALDLLDRDHDAGYYIMDDCPPLGACHARHLNETVPGWLRCLSASCISLVGWDQRRVNRGEILGRDAGWIQRQAPDFEWQYSTDPGFWDWSAFRDLLDAFAPNGDPASRSAWAFERRLGGPDSIVPERWRGTSYKIRGIRMMGGTCPRGRAALRLAGYRAYDMARLVTRSVGGQRALDCLDRWAGTETDFYAGPYPTYWAGVMTKGVFNPKVARFLRRRGRWRYVRELVSCVARVGRAEL
jgi:hypothetical protein